jgi:hypothetical protein
MPPQLDIEGVLRPGRILVVAGACQQQLQPALLQHIPTGLPAAAPSPPSPPWVMPSACSQSARASRLEVNLG